MITFFNELIGSKIILFQEKTQVGSVLQVIVSPKDGSFLGFLVKAMGKNQVVPATEIKMIGSDFIMVKDFNSLTDPTEVVRIKEALDFGAKILGEKVQTECGQKLGRVVNATLNLRLLMLDKIYVSAKFPVKALAKDLLISASKIVEIKKEVIVVTDDFAKVKEGLPVAIPVPE